MGFDAPIAVEFSRWFAYQSRITTGIYRDRPLGVDTAKTVPGRGTTPLDSPVALSESRLPAGSPSLRALPGLIHPAVRSASGQCLPAERTSSLNRLWPRAVVPRVDAIPVLARHTGVVGGLVAHIVHGVRLVGAADTPPQGVEMQAVTRGARATDDWHMSGIPAPPSPNHRDDAPAPKGDHLVQGIGREGRSEPAFTHVTGWTGARPATVGRGCMLDRRRSATWGSPSRWHAPSPSASPFALRCHRQRYSRLAATVPDAWRGRWARRTRGLRTSMRFGLAMSLTG
jgi:hypothetical protein